MRIGLAIREQRPEYGGAYTFQGEVLRAFAALRRESRHEFLVLCPTDRIAEYARSALPAGSVRLEPFIEPPHVPPPLQVRVRRRLGLEPPPAAPVVDLRARNEQLAREHGVQLIWGVSHSEGHYDLPYTTIVWDLEHRNKPWFPEIAGGGLWEERERTFATILPRASYVIAGTQTGKREIHEFYGVPEERIRILPHPTPRFDDLDPSGDPPLPAPLGRRPFLIYPAQFWPHKNHVNLVLSLLEAGDDMDLALTGSDKGNRAHVEEIVRANGLAARVHFLGFIDRRTLAALYRKALALAYVSFCGPENLPPLEAFALGCPVIAADIPGAREQLGDCALLVDPGKPSSIAQAIRRLAGDEALRRSLVGKGRERAARWTAEHFVRGMFAVFDEFEAMRRAWP